MTFRLYQLGVIIVNHMWSYLDAPFHYVINRFVVTVILKRSLLHQMSNNICT